MTALPNPFLNSALAAAMPAETAVAPDLTDHLVATADDLPLPELLRRGFDVEAFMNDLDPLPAFLSAPSQGYLRAAEMRPIVEVLAGHM